MSEPVLTVDVQEGMVLFRLLVPGSPEAFLSDAPLVATAHFEGPCPIRPEVYVRGGVMYTLGAGGEVRVEMKADRLGPVAARGRWVDRFKLPSARGGLRRMFVSDIPCVLRVEDEGALSRQILFRASIDPKQTANFCCSVQIGSMEGEGGDELWRPPTEFVGIVSDQEITWDRARITQIGANDENRVVNAKKLITENRVYCFPAMDGLPEVAHARGASLAVKAILKDLLRYRFAEGSKILVTANPKTLPFVHLMRRKAIAMGVEVVELHEDVVSVFDGPVLSRLMGLDLKGTRRVISVCLGGGTVQVLEYVAARGREGGIELRVRRTYTAAIGAETIAEEVQKKLPEGEPPEGIPKEQRKAAAGYLVRSEEGLPEEVYRGLWEELPVAVRGMVERFRPVVKEMLERKLGWLERVARELAAGPAEAGEDFPLLCAYGGGALARSVMERWKAAVRRAWGLTPEETDPEILLPEGDPRFSQLRGSDGFWESQSSSPPAVVLRDEWLGKDVGVVRRVGGGEELHPVFRWSATLRLDEVRPMLVDVPRTGELRVGVKSGDDVIHVATIRLVEDTGKPRRVRRIWIWPVNWMHWGASLGNPLWPGEAGGAVYFSTSPTDDPDGDGAESYPRIVIIPNTGVNKLVF